MRHKKEQILAAFKKSETICLSKQILEYKLYRLNNEYNSLKSRMERARAANKPCHRLLLKVQSYGSKVKVLKEVIFEIESAEKEVDKMFRVEINDQVFYRANENSHRRRQCGKKIRYTSFDEAQEMLDVLYSSNAAKYEAYKCNYCDFWHIGHSVV